ncbi:MAG: fused MFS/spermidine synthase [bacterium]
MSGASALVYEVAWVRKFSVVAGGSTRSLTAVLAAYMGGLALGSFLGGRYIDRRKSRPFVVYAVLEGLVGVSAFLLTLLIPALVPVLKVGRELFGAASFGFDFYRFLISALVMFIPTTLMGATFPVLIKGVLSSKSRFGAVAGVLYASNTLGAMAGSLLAGFLLIPSLGLFRTIGVAAVLNVSILAVALAIPYFRRVRTEASGEKAAAGRAGRRTFLSWVFLWGYAVSGLCAMVYQVGWARALSLSLGSSTYAVGIIFASFIGGLALGGFIISPVVDRMKSRLLLAAGLEVLIGLSAIAVIPLFESVTIEMFYWSRDYQARFGMYQLVRFAAAFGLILVPTIAMGALFPVVVKIIGSIETGVGEPAGQVFGFNTVGGIVGAFLAAHVFIRFLGLENALLAATAISVAVGVIWLLVSPGGRRLFRWGAAVGLAGAATGGILLVPQWDPLFMNSGPYMYSEILEKDFPESLDLRDFLHDNERILFHEAGVEATVSVMEWRRTLVRTLTINGKVDASSKKDMPTQVLSAHLPLLLHPHPKEIMMLGLASGVSAGSALLHPVEQVDCAEISPAVVSASRLFKEEGVSKLDYEDPRFNLILDDGRHFLDLSEKRYDVIIAEPSNPWIAGMSVLFTREFFSIMKKHLKPGGVALIWIGAYDMDSYTVKMLLRTFQDVFENSTIWESKPAVDYFLIGSTKPIEVDLEKFIKRAGRKKIAEDLARVNINRPRQLLARFVMGPDTIRQVAGEGPLHTDDRRQLEFMLPKIKKQEKDKRIAEILITILSAHQPASSIVSGADAEDEKLFEDFHLNRSIYYRTLHKRLAPRQPEGEGGNAALRIQNWYNLIHRCQGAFPAEFAEEKLSMLLYRRAKGYLKEGMTGKALEDLKEAFKLDPENSNAAGMLIAQYNERGQTREAVRWARKVLEAIPRDPYALSVVANYERSRGQVKRAEYLFRLAVEASPRNREYRYNLAVFLAQTGKLEKARKHLETMFKYNPPTPTSKELYCHLLNDLDEKAKANKCFQELEELSSAKQKQN